MRKWLFAIMALSILIIAGAAPVHAESPMAVVYRLLTQTETETATMVTMELEVTNTDVFEITNLTMTLASLAGGEIQGKAELKVLAPGATTTISTVFTAPRGLLEVEPLFFEASYLDSKGQQQTTIIQGTKR
jgi:hypothetical protein